MTTLAELSSSFNNMLPKMKANVKSTLSIEANILLKEFQARSPLDTGFYRSNWRITKPRFSAIGSISIGLMNNDPKATIMEFGALKNQAPWYYPNGTGKKRPKRTGKLTESGGRIWAGGLRPGHTKTIGGAIDPVLYNNDRKQLAIAKKVANALIEGMR